VRVRNDRGVQRLSLIEPPQLPETKLYAGDAEDHDNQEQNDPSLGEKEPVHARETLQVSALQWDAALFTLEARQTLALLRLFRVGAEEPTRRRAARYQCRCDSKKVSDYHDSRHQLPDDQQRHDRDR